MTGLSRLSALALGLALTLAACGDEEIILPGERVDLRADPDVTEETGADRARPLSLPAPTLNSSWTHVSANPQHFAGHPALGAALSPLWSVPIGEGNDRKHRITADPVSDGSRIYTLDSRARVSAFSLSGELVWARDLTPASDRPDDASGGGLAVEDGTLYVSTAFGELHAVDATSGAERWVQDLDAAATGAPTVAGGAVHVVTRNAVAWAVDTGTGRILWQTLGTVSDSGIAGGPAPAIAGDLVIYPYSSAQMIAVSRGSGEPVWSAIVGGERLGRAFSRVSDLTGDPVVVGQTVFAGNHAGRSAAFDLATGEQLWSAEGGAMSPVTVMGGSVFLVSDENRLMRLDAATGAEIWGNPLDLFPQRRFAKRRSTYAHFGPVIAGGRLLVGSDDGLLRQYNPQSGRLLATLRTGAPIARNPVVAGGTLFLVTGDGMLRAYR